MKMKMKPILEWMKMLHDCNRTADDLWCELRLQTYDKDKGIDIVTHQRSPPLTVNTKNGLHLSSSI